MNSIVSKQTATDNSTNLPSMIEAASSALLSARTSAEVLDARDMARIAYDAAKSTGRIAKAKEAHDDIIRAVLRAQADAAAIEARAKMRLADEYDAAQERGEVAKIGDNLPRVGDHNSRPTASDIGLRRDEIHEARKLRDAEAKEPGKVERVLDDLVSRGEEPSKANLRRGMLEGAAEFKVPEKSDTPEEAEVRKHFDRLTDEARVDEFIALSLNLSEAKEKIKSQKIEIEKLKNQLSEFSGDQAAVIRRQAQTIRHKESEMFRANEKAAQAMKQVHALKKRVAELESMEINL